MLVALPLNYAFTAVATGFTARFLPLDPGQAALAATLVSFAVFAVIVLAAFSVRSIARLWLLMTLTGVSMALLTWQSILLQGRL